MSYAKQLILRYNRNASSPLGVEGETRVPRHFIMNGQINEKLVPIYRGFFVGSVQTSPLRIFYFYF